MSNLASLRPRSEIALASSFMHLPMHELSGVNLLERGNMSHGQMSVAGTTTSIWTDGRGVLFNGIDNVAALYHANIDAHIRLDNLVGAGQLLVSLDIVPTNFLAASYPLECSIFDTTNGGFAASLSITTGLLAMKWQYAGGGSAVTVGSAAVSAAVRHSAQMFFDGLTQQGKLYIDGVLQGSATLNSGAWPTLYTSRRLSLGGRTRPSDGLLFDPYPGVLDRVLIVRVVNGDLAPDMVAISKALYRTPAELPWILHGR